MASALDNSVASGRTGVITNTTAYSVLCAGTTATGAIQSTATAGTSGQVLTSNGSAALPTFQTGGGTGVTVLLGTATASASANLAFTGIFSSSYNSYLFLFTDVLPATNAQGLQALLGTGGGPTYITANYNWGQLAFHGGSQVAGAGSTSDSSAGISPTTGISNTTYGYSGLMVLNGPNGSSNVAMASGSVVYFDGTYPANMSVSWLQPAAIFTAIKFQMTSGNITSGRIEVYGIKNT